MWTAGGCQEAAWNQVQGWVGENMKANLCHQKNVYDVCSKGSSRPYQVSDLVWLEEKAVPRWMDTDVLFPWSGPWRVVKIKLDVTYRIQCEEVAPMRERRKVRIIVHFNRPKLYLGRPSQPQPRLDDVEEVGNRSVGLNVGEHALMKSPEAPNMDPFSEDRSTDEGYRNYQPCVWPATKTFSQEPSYSYLDGRVPHKGGHW